ncbi:MAG: GAF domain-containing protein [Hyphomicrobiales bacterium]|nr:MAG: GAF domain-containing protein [Hyphomicrobiales bacterium]
MDMRTTPAFGRADLSNCEREQIHLAGSIQPHGALLVVREPDLSIVQISKNAPHLLRIKDLIGRPLQSLGGDLVTRLTPLLKLSLRTIPAPFRCTLGEPATAFDGQVHRSADGGLILEFETAGKPIDLSGKLESALRSVVTAPSITSLCEEAASFFKTITGYDRVMVYRFDDQGHGEVFSERKRPDLEPYLGNRYPASDIPQIARRLYERNRIRLLADIGYEPVPLTPRLSPLTGRDLDMSLCCLRSMSPIHVQYLKNMGVLGTLVISLVVGGKLWGLVACHHYEPRRVQFEVRTACELLGEVVATRISALESFAQAQAELSVRRLEQRMIEAIAREGDWRAALFDGTNALLQIVSATGCALLFEGQVQTFGDVPGTQDLRAIGDWLQARTADGLYATTQLGLEEPGFAHLIPVASGVLAVALSQAEGEYLIWFRPEQVRTVTWGGDPEKPMVIGDDPADLSPRRSFAQWHQVVEGTAEDWQPAEISAARLLGKTLQDVVIQFRAVRLVIAQHQLEQVSQQVRHSAAPVLVCDTAGQILLANEALHDLLPDKHVHLHFVEDLAPFFTNAASVRNTVRELLAAQRAWRGELMLQSGTKGANAVMVRADPVTSPGGGALGYVFTFSDLRERAAAEAARERFQYGIVERNEISLKRVETAGNPHHRQLFTSIIENAQLAAMEITESANIPHMPELLESVRASVSRSAELLDLLIGNAKDKRKQG